ncbi:unnamed protein product [Lupinus luteus]|uniref:Uncharacterized protein n=1 Tax=Lupinus luteus TaxID=3873 RepID=A0AAV1XS28_LUPLU
MENFPLIILVWRNSWSSRLPCFRSKIIWKENEIEVASSLILLGLAKFIISQFTYSRSIVGMELVITYLLLIMELSSNESC